MAYSYQGELSYFGGLSVSEPSTNSPHAMSDFCTSNVLVMAARALQFVCLAGIARRFAERNPLRLVSSTAHQDQNFILGDQSFLTTTSAPVLKTKLDAAPGLLPATHIIVTDTVVTAKYLQDTIEGYLADDDVYLVDFLELIVLSSNSSWQLDESAVEFVQSIGSKVISLPAEPAAVMMAPPGPLFAVFDGQTLELSKVFRLYTDDYSDFVHGTYESNGTHKVLDLVDPVWGYPLIPVPSRLYSKVDQRPLAGKRIGVKDIYDIKGLVTTLGSKAWTRMATDANATAPSIQRIIDLGGTVVGKQKTSQFASGALAWEWTDVYHPQNPRGDGYLSCSASSAGGGCSIAAYDWLDLAIGSDTGQSMRQPAAFSGTYGNRPSQGLMDLGGVMPISHATDTGGVFSRDPHEWVEFSKLWYDPSMHQDSSFNELPKLVVPDARTFPRRILYAADHLPLRNPAAEAVLQSFLGQVSDALGLKVEKINLTETVETATGRGYHGILADILTFWTYTLRKVVATPLIEYYKPEFPALDRPFRTSFRDFTVDPNGHNAALERRRQDAEAWHRDVLYSTEESCSESMIIYDIGTGGLPSFREAEMNNVQGAALPAGPGTIGAASIVASYFGDVDFTLPIGEVPYFSGVTYREEMMPVTINVVVKRGCDFVLFNLVEDLADRGILRTVSTGSRTFT